MSRYLAFCRCFAIALAVGTAGSVLAQPASGDLWVLRVGDGVAALGTTSTAVNIDRFSILGAPVLPSITVSGPTVSLAGSATSEGFLSRSADGQFVTFGTYAAPTGTATVASSTVTRQVNRIDFGLVSNVSALGTAFSGGNIRSVSTTDGTNFWASSSNQGVHYHLFGSNTTSGNLATLPTALTNTRVANIINGQLFTSSASGAFVGANAVGTGLPTAPPQTTTNVLGAASGTGTPSPYGYVGLDNPLNPVVGIDTMYVADDRTAANGGGIQRWTFDGATWTLPAGAAGTAAPGTVGARGITASITGNLVSIYATTTESNANRLVTINDVLAAGGGTFDPLGFTTLATAAANTAFRGVAFSPVPEPTLVLAIAGGALAIGARLRRRVKVA